jgi:hypothetical protein
MRVGVLFQIAIIPINITIIFTTTTISVESGLNGYKWQAAVGH